MMRALHVWFVVAAVVLLICGTATEALGDTLDPDKWKPSDEDPRSYAAVSERFAEELEAYDYARVFRQLECDLREWMGGGPSDTVHQHLLGAFEILNGRFVDYDKLFRELVLDRGKSPDDAVEAFMEVHPTGYFNPLGWKWFKPPNTVSYADVGQMEDTASAEDFLYRQDTAKKLLSRFSESIRNENFRGIHLAARRWEHFLDDGKMMYPWEVILNGMLIRGYDIETPPTHQWILLHPQVCASLSSDSWSELKAKDALCVQALGHMWYSWKDDDHPENGMRWLGASAIAVLRDDAGPALGVALEFGRSATIGAAWYDSDGDDDWFDDEPSVVLSVDLLSFAQEEMSAYRSTANEAIERLGTLINR